MQPVQVSWQRLALFLAVLTAVTVALLAGKISAEIWMALVGGALVPSPLSDSPVLSKRMPSILPEERRKTDHPTSSSP